MSQFQGSNTLYGGLKCPRCGKEVTSGVGFRVGALKGATYNIGEKLDWSGARLRPAQRPDSGNLKTIGYFECDNLECETWQDCYPEVQEALVTIKADIISEVKPYTHKPNELVFDIIEPKEANNEAN